MVHSVSQGHLDSSLNADIGPLVDDGAEYSAIGCVELKIIFDIDTTRLDELPSSLHGHTHWQYGQGAHSSPEQKMLGSIVLSVQVDNRTIINIRHVVIDGPSQWVIGRNVTAVTNIIHIGRNAIEIINDQNTDYISIVNRKRLSFIPLSSFMEGTEHSTINNFHGTIINERPWKDVKAIVDKVHKHVADTHTSQTYACSLKGTIYGSVPSRNMYQKHSETVNSVEQ